jgi:hypothetical protein
MPARFSKDIRADGSPAQDLTGPRPCDIVARCYHHREDASRVLSVSALEHGERKAPRMTTQLFVLLTMDCETARQDVTAQRGAAGEQGYEWPYIPAPYDHRQVVQHILERGKSDGVRISTLVTDTHNDQDHTDPAHPAAVNLSLILHSARSCAAALEVDLVGATLETICDRVLADGAQNPVGSSHPRRVPLEEKRCPIT